MYSKQQASQVRQEFWTTFGRYMQPVLSSEGQKVNWINYKTGAKHIYFRMQAGKGAVVSIDLLHPDAEKRLSDFAQLHNLRHLLHDITGEEWNWQADVEGDQGKRISRISLSLENVHVFNKADWPALISFFKPRIIALDSFWNEVKHQFDVW